MKYYGFWRSSRDKETGRYCHGDSPTVADICLATQVFGARFFNCDTAAVPTVMRVFDECMKLERSIARTP